MLRPRPATVLASCLLLGLTGGCEGGSSGSDEGSQDSEGGSGDVEATTGEIDSTGGQDGSTGSDDDGPPPGTDDGPAPGECPAEVFPAQGPDPANAAYPDPFLEVSCTETELVVRSNGIPSYAFQATTPNDLQAQDHEWHIPLLPTEAPAPAEIPLLGPTAIAVNGMPIFGPNEAAMPDPYGDPIYNGIMDFCLGHTAMGGLYHYHGLLVSCLVGEVPADEPSPIIGYAFDGHPIYGPVGCVDAECSEVVTFRSGWEQTGDPSTYAWDAHQYVASEDPAVLDQCNGRVGPDGNYRYHATDTFPYVLGCYHGEATGG